MFYWGARESSSYLRKLSRLRDETRPHSLFSIIGGLGFLHAIGQSTFELRLCDRDPEALLHCRLILRLIEVSPNLNQFISFLTSHYVHGMHPSAFLALGEPINYTGWLESYLEPGLLELYKIGYGSLRESDAPVIQENQINFFEPDETLPKRSFNWHLGQPGSAFESSDSFNLLRERLQSLTTEDTLYFESEIIDSPITEPNVKVDLIHLCVSNADFPGYTRQDVILRQLKSQIQILTRYVSWNRDMLIEPNPQTRIMKLIEEQRSAGKLVELTHNDSTWSTHPEAWVLFNWTELSKINWPYSSDFINQSASLLIRDPNPETDWVMFAREICGCFHQIFITLSRSHSVRILVMLQETVIVESYTISLKTEGEYALLMCALDGYQQ